LMIFKCFGSEGNVRFLFVGVGFSLGAYRKITRMGEIYTPFLTKWIHSQNSQN
jgi:hypothetical protein